MKENRGQKSHATVPLRDCSAKTCCLTVGYLKHKLQVNPLIEIQKITGDH